MTRLKALAGERRTMVFYESPHRLVKALAQFYRTFSVPDAGICFAGNFKGDTKKRCVERLQN